VSEDEVLSRLRECRVLPMATVDDADQAEQAAHALARGGIGCIEITFRTDTALDALRRVRETVDGVLLGAGTVLTAEQAQAAAGMGADFAVAPGLNEEVLDCCRNLGLPFFPGVATPTEIERALQLGLQTLKVFPVAQLGGPPFLRAVSATYPDVRFVPSGGIDADSVADYLSVPAVLACGGSWLVKPTLLRAGRFDEVERLARLALEGVPA
jgi:2-dehydro-3-deoxyphosphogluconate aldolase / (4S)-4-hydroxy-2-oxoglutarate aldolase